MYSSMWRTETEKKDRKQIHVTIILIQQTNTELYPNRTTSLQRTALLNTTHSLLYTEVSFQTLYPKIEDKRLSPREGGGKVPSLFDSC